MKKSLLALALIICTFGVAWAGGLSGMPFSGSYRMSSDFGPRPRPCSGCSAYHPAHDYATPVGTPMISTVSGTVTRVVNSNSGYGNFVSIKSASGNYAVQYSHLDSSSVTVGQTVSAGDTIALSGNSGAGTGAHLDYKVSVLDPATGQFVPVDPALAMGADLDDPAVRVALVADSQAKLNGSKTTNVGDGTAAYAGANAALGTEGSSEFEGPLLGCDPNVLDENKTIIDALKDVNAEIIKANIGQPTPVETMTCLDQKLETLSASGNIHANPTGDISASMNPFAKIPLVNNITNILNSASAQVNALNNAINSTFSNITAAFTGALGGLGVGAAPSTNCDMTEQAWLINQCVKMPKIPSLSDVLGGKIAEINGALGALVDPDRFIQELCGKADASIQGFFSDFNSKLDEAADKATKPITDI